MSGATPRGARNQQEVAARVREMFGRVAHRYDVANHLLSFNIDRHWRAYTVSRVRHILARPEARVLDICCGTGDLALALAEARGSGARPVTGSDFCHPMLVSAREKLAARRSSAALFEGDALNLPVADGALDLITVAFGFRNLADYAAGLREMRRVLRPGGTAAILEFSQPPNRAFAALYNFYSHRVLPAIGGVLSGSPDAYRYLPESVSRFPNAPALAESMSEAGFVNVNYKRLTGGIVALHTGEI
jgi:demethylmenaquinone methyltransferase / 2-methoxy-6-polyprenyl-1,4-benzoquinol methylase